MEFDILKWALSKNSSSATASLSEALTFVWIFRLKFVTHIWWREFGRVLWTIWSRPGKPVDPENKVNGYRPDKAIGHGRKLSLRIPPNRQELPQPIAGVCAERKGLIEHVFGALRYLMGQILIKQRGLRKIKTEIGLYSGTFNLDRWKNPLTGWCKKWSDGIQLHNYQPGWWPVETTLNKVSTEKWRSLLK